MNESTQVALLKERAPRALDYVYEAYAASLYGIIYRVVGEEGVAEELLKDTFVTIWEKIDAYDSQKYRFFTWIMQIARNQAMDYLRSKKDTQSGEADLVLSNGPTIEMLLKKHDRPLQNLLDNLPPEQGEVIKLVYFAGYSQIEAAKKLNISLETIKTRLRSALIKLRELLHFSL
uniref:Sigma-70 family RNA polymerase sigma factor n=1 Tax=Roseihalotalea indica TaxID=2867963 RepID=A0AA49JHU8_9BACT|nr:sigma-70 family RNA polymerase sigma factor [Tunicatimonas sp. TK19036]